MFSSPLKILAYSIWFILYFERTPDKVTKNKIITADFSSTKMFQKILKV